VILRGLTNKRYTKGRHTSVSIPLPGNGAQLRGLRLRLKRNSWPDTGQPVIRAAIEITEDGATWTPFLAGEAHGGNPVDKNGNVATHSTMVFHRLDDQKNVIPLFSGPNSKRRIRIVVELLEDLDLEADIDTE